VLVHHSDKTQRRWLGSGSPTGRLNLHWQHHAEDNATGLVHQLHLYRQAQLTHTDRHTRRVNTNPHANHSTRHQLHLYCQSAAYFAYCRTIFFIIQQSAPIAYFSCIGIFDGSSNINCVSITGHLFLLGFGNS